MQLWALIKEASKLNIDPSIGVDRLAQTCMQKQDLLTRIGQSLITLKTKVTSGDILNNICCRIKQQSEASTEDSNVICCHMHDYTWEMAFRKLKDQQISGLTNFPPPGQRSKVCLILSVHFNLSFLQERTAPQYGAIDICGQC